MPLINGDQVKWDDSLEPCEDGICLGVVTQAHKFTLSASYTVEWWQLCGLHREVDINGTGPYHSDSLTKIQ